MMDCNKKLTQSSGVALFGYHLLLYPFSSFKIASSSSFEGVVVKQETEKPETKRNETRLPKLKRSLPSILSCKKNGDQVEYTAPRILRL